MKPPKALDRNQTIPADIQELGSYLRDLFNKTADAHDVPYEEKVLLGLLAVYNYGRCRASRGEAKS